MYKLYVQCFSLLKLKSLCNCYKVCHSGVSAEALQLADSTSYIPMSGFVSSFNVSVAAALVFYEARRARLARLGYHCDLSDHEQQILTAVMLLRHQVLLDVTVTSPVYSNNVIGT